MKITKSLILAIPSLQAGGMERVMSVLANNFERQHELTVHLVLYGMNREVFYELDDKIIIHKPNFVFKKRPRIFSTLLTLKWLRKEFRLIDAERILSFGEYWNSFVLLSTIGLNKKVYVSDRCQPTKNFGVIHEILRIWLYPKAEGIIFQTSTAESYYLDKRNHDNTIVIGNPLRNIVNSDRQNRENIVLTVGRLIATKNHDDMIRIFSEITFMGWKLIIVGADAIKENTLVKLKNLVKKLNIESSVEFTGSITNVDDYYLKSKIFAFTSSSEGFPNVIGEAMMAGLPVVAYDCIAGPRDMIEHGVTGYLIPLHDQKSFKEHLIKLMSNENDRAVLGKKSKSKIQNFEENFISSKYLGFIFKS